MKTVTSSVISSEFKGTFIQIAVLGDTLLTKSLLKKFCRIKEDPSLLGEMYSHSREVEIKTSTVDHDDGSSIYKFQMLASEQDDPKSINRTLPAHSPQFVIYVYDPTDEEGLIKIKRWIDEIKQYNLVEGTYIPLLIANKVDFTRDNVITEKQAQQFARDNGIQQMQYYEINASNMIEDADENDSDIEAIIRETIPLKWESLKIQLDTLDQAQLKRAKEELAGKRTRRSEDRQRELAARPSEEVQQELPRQTTLLRQLCGSLTKHGVVKIEIAPDPGKATFFGWGPTVNKGQPAFRFYFNDEAAAKTYSNYIAAARRTDGSRISNGTLDRFNKSMMVVSEEGARRIFTANGLNETFRGLILEYSLSLHTKSDLVLSSDFSPTSSASSLSPGSSSGGPT